jgi:hypothetical protein
MKRTAKKIADLPLEQRALLALRAAARKAIAEDRKLGLPVYVWRNGRVEELPAPPPRTRKKR